MGLVKNARKKTTLDFAFRALFIKSSTNRCLFHHNRAYNGRVVSSLMNNVTRYVRDSLPLGHLPQS